MPLWSNPERVWSVVPKLLTLVRRALPTHEFNIMPLHQAVHGVAASAAINDHEHAC
jgi:hypothetical protein